MLEKTGQILRKAGARLRSIIVSSQYGEEKVRKTVAHASKAEKLLNPTLSLVKLN